MDSNQSKRGGSTKSPCQTPRSTDKSNRDLRAADCNSNPVSKNEKEKGVNIQVIVRCRPFNSEEARLQTPAVLTCNDRKKEVAVAQNIAGKQIDKTFLFDKVFGPTSQQKDLYHQAVSPIVFEVLDGYNCTIFAYGQTGTGKTYTMEGGARKKNGEIPTDAGVIPRAVKQIFDILEAQSAAEYSLNVSGTIHIKECTPEGEEIVKSGKLNLVDLAGSENISRSGAREGKQVDKIIERLIGRKNKIMRESRSSNQGES